MNLGLIGAIGGLGQGLTQIGNDIVKERERALEWAQQEAMRQRELAAKREDATTAFTREKELQTQAEQSRANIERLSQSAQDRRTAFVQGKEDIRQQKSLASQRDLAKLRGQIERDNSTYSARLRDQLSADDVHGIVYGPPDKNGYSEVFTITNDGHQRSTHMKAFRPMTTSQVVGTQDDGL